MFSSEQIRVLAPNPLYFPKSRYDYMNKSSCELNKLWQERDWRKVSNGTSQEKYPN